MTLKALKEANEPIIYFDEVRISLIFNRLSLDIMSSESDV